MAVCEILAVGSVKVVFEASDKTVVCACVSGTFR